MSGVSRAAAWYMVSRQVQNVPEPTWTRPRRARWKAWLWLLARPGRVKPRRTVAPGGGAGTPERTAVRRPPAVSRTTPEATPPSGSQACSAQ